LGEERENAAIEAPSGPFMTRELKKERFNSQGGWETDLKGAGL